jgi:hypothetical protein
MPPQLRSEAQGATMKFCPKCGAVADSEDRFCQNCGSQFGQTRGAAPAATSQEDDDKTVMMPSRNPASPAAQSRPDPSAGASAGRMPPLGGSARPEAQSPRAAAATALPKRAEFAGQATDRSAWLGWLLARIKNILFSPKAEWPVIEAETETVSGLYKRYVVPLQAAASTAGLLGSAFVLAGIGFGLSLVGALLSAVVGFVLGLLLVFVVALIVDALAPSFGGQKSTVNALKLVAYAYTPSYIGGLVLILPFLSPLMLLFALYGLYLLYLGLPVLMRCPKEKAPVYTAVIVVIALVLSLIIGVVTGGIAALLGLGIGAASVGSSAPAVLSGITGGKDSAETNKRLEDWTRQMEAASKKMEEAEKSGDPKAIASAAGDALGAALSGGRKVEPVDFRELKALLPEGVGGMRRAKASGESSGMGGLSVSTAEARYDGGGKSMDLKIVDMGGAGLAAAGLAAWSMVEIDKETESGRERTGKLDGRPFHEQYDERNRSGEFALLVGQRFLVEARGSDVDLNTLKSLVGAVDLARLESMKDVGAKN